MQWRLLTNREVNSLEQASELIDWYRARWEIEMFFHVLKTGCRVQALQLASLPRIERALALFMVVSWRICAFRGSSGAAASASPCAGAPRGAGISGKKKGPETIRALQFGGGRADQRTASSPLRSRMSSSFCDGPLGRLSPTSHLRTVDVLVFSTLASTA